MTGLGKKAGVSDVVGAVLVTGVFVFLVYLFQPIEVMNGQDYLYMLQICMAFAALIIVFIVFRYETIDKYTDTRKEALRDMLNIKDHPERAEWIQNIGKEDVNIKTYYQELSELNTPSVDTFIGEIKEKRCNRHKLMKEGKKITIFWGLMAIFYLFAQIFQLYGAPYYCPLMLGFLLPLLFSARFLQWAIGPFY